MPHTLLPALALGLATHLVGQAVPAPGFRLFGPINGTATYLVDDSGAIVHTWPSGYQPGLGVYLLADGSLLRAIVTTTPPTGLNGGGGGVQRLAFDGRVLWDYRFPTNGLLSHHDIAPLPNGNVLLIVWQDKTVAEAIAAGRDPALISGAVFRPDSIYEIQPTGPSGGAAVWSWHVWDHVIQDFDASKANFGVVANHPELVDINFPAVATEAYDWNHCNGIDYDPIHDWIVISAPRQNEVWILDHSTTAAQAAGHTGGRWGKGGDLLYRWGNPAAYRAGTALSQQLSFEHDPRFVPPGRPGAGHLTIFNNGFVSGTNSAAAELVLPLDAAGNFVLGGNGRYGPVAPLWNYTAPGFFSGIISSAERLPNGNTLICSGSQSRVFEVTASGDEVWSFTMPGGALVFHAHYVERSLWSDAATVSIAGGGTVGFDLEAGSQQAGQFYLLIGSFTGTTPGFVLGGVHMALNLDLFTDFTYSQANSPALINTMGLLSSGGSASAALTVPAGVVPPELAGLRLDFGYLVADPTTAQIRRASSVVPLVLVP